MENKTQPRYVVQLVTRNMDESDAQLIALCIDNSMWTLLGNGSWKQLQSIPDNENS